MAGAKGLFDASKSVQRNEWQNYFRTTNIAEKNPELYGIAYVERVKNRNKMMFAEQVRHDTSTRPTGYPDFTIFPERQKDEVFVLKYIEPTSLEAKAMGFDMSSDPSRLRALQKAGETGEMVMTPFIKFVTGASGPSIYIPIYRKGVPLDTPQHRESAVEGFIVSGLSMPQFFQEIFRHFKFQRGFSIRIYQRGVDGEKDIPFYNSTTKSNVIQNEPEARYRKTTSIQIGGQMWELESVATSEFKRSAQILSWIILFGATSIGTLSFGVVIFIVVSNVFMARREKRIAEELHTSNQFLESIIENIPNMIFVKDAKELRFVRFNRAGEELLGYQRSELMGKNDYDFFPKEQADFFTEKDQIVLRRAELTDIPEEPIMTRQKGERILHTKKIPLLGNDGKPSYLLGISEDITMHRREERARAEFVTLVSHQLRTPLSTMRWSFEILKERASHFSDTERRLMEQSYTAMLNMSQTINTMLSVAHIDTMKIAITPADLDLTNIIKTLVDEYKIEAESKHLRLTLSSPREFFIRSDSTLLREVFSNLLSNAIRYTPDGGKIIVSVLRERLQAVVTIKDSGIGIPESAMGSIFEKLFRGENARKMHASGSGLGLYVVRSLTTLLSGTVSATSQEGKGATFVVRLPLLPSS